MLTGLGCLAILALLALILFRLTSVLVALTLVPVVVALAAGLWREVGGFALFGIQSVAPVAALLAFAVVYFGVMNDAGLFAPAICWSDSPTSIWPTTSAGPSLTLSRSAS